jgi:hypothetical protein
MLFFAVIVVSVLQLPATSAKLLSMAQRSYDAKSREEKNHLDRGMIGFWIRVFIFFLGAFLIASIAWAKDQSPVAAQKRSHPQKNSPQTSVIVIRKVENKDCPVSISFHNPKKSID